MDGRALKMSGVGKAVMCLCRHPKETRQNKKIAGQLISEYDKCKLNCVVNAVKIVFIRRFA